MFKCLIRNRSYRSVPWPERDISIAWHLCRLYKYSIQVRPDQMKLDSHFHDYSQRSCMYPYVVYHLTNTNYGHHLSILSSQTLRLQIWGHLVHLVLMLSPQVHRFVTCIATSHPQHLYGSPLNTGSETSSQRIPVQIPAPSRLKYSRIWTFNSRRLRMCMSTYNPYILDDIRAIHMDMSSFLTH